MNPKKTFYVWKCAHCEHRNKEVFNFHWKMDHKYNTTWFCSKCGSESYIKFNFNVWAITEKHSEGYYDMWH